MANKSYENFPKHRAWPKKHKELFAKAKEETIQQLVYFISGFTSEPVLVYKDMKKIKDYQDVIESVLLPFTRSHPGRKKVIFVAYTGHGCTDGDKAYTFAVLDDAKGSIYPIEIKMINIGQREDTYVFGILSCCRTKRRKQVSDNLFSEADEPNLALFKGSIIYGC